ncbi:MAG: AAA family ATPase [Planctomycetes bacterium]|nr:AAA family ATPase [Planctomycetota bacterium]
MRISSVTLKNFRCFGPEVETVRFRNVTALVGANGTGKSAALQALTRLFGTGQGAHPRSPAGAGDVQRVP